MKLKKFAGLFVLIFCALFLSVSFLLCGFLYPAKYYGVIVESCNRYNVDKSIIFAIIKAESNFDKNAISSAGACGLMQLMPKTALYIANKIGYNEDDIDLFDERINIELGTAYYNYLFEKFEKFDVAICAYNAGENEVSKWLDSSGNLRYIKYNETKNYLNKVLYARKVYAEKLKNNQQIF